ncbi:unnamed protein product, partial [Rotaria sordida]
MAGANPNATVMCSQPILTSTPCQAKGCQRSSATTCDHCNKHVCRFHFNEHAQSLTEELYELTSQIIQLDEEIKQLDLASLKKHTLEKLTGWHKQGIERLNTFYEEKKMEIDQALVNGRNYLCQTAEKLKEETNALLQDNESKSNSGPGYLFGGFKNEIYYRWPVDHVDEVKYNRREFLFTLTNPHQIRPMIVEEGGQIHMFQEFQRPTSPM